MPSLQDNLGRIQAEIAATLAGVDGPAAERLIDLLDAAPAVFLAGAGRSGLVARGLAIRLMHIGKTVHVAGETTAPAIRGGDALLIVSGSGRTGSMTGLARTAGAAGARIALLTAVAETELAGRADAAVVLPLAESAQPLASLFEQAALLFCDGAVMDLMRRRGVRAEEMALRHANLE